MGLIEEAVALERKAEEAYRLAAAATPDVGARTILLLLADAEAGHVVALMSRKDAADLRGRNLIEAARAWVRGAVEGGGALSSDAGLLPALRRAMDSERATEAFYRTQGATADDSRVRALFAALADAEADHYRFVSSLVEYYNRPNEWVESAEFGLRPEY
ncbi:MAG: ferritin family protein [Candidatus Bipolaricaulis sp.]|nr:ferritin family protein [Candidatus Bipolaricaulis sp.]